jgi:hypothetical protein
MELFHTLEILDLRCRRGGDKIHNKNKELKKSEFRRTTNDKTTIILKVTIHLLGGSSIG